MTEENQQAEKNDTDYRSKISKFTIDLSRRLQHRIRLAARKNNLSISDYVEHILDEAVPDSSEMRRERRPATRKMLDELMQVREQIMEHTNGKIFEDSTELIRQMREERSRELEQL